MKRTFFIPLISTPVYAIRQTGYDIPFIVQFLQGAYKKNGRNWRLNQSQNNCPIVMKDKMSEQQKQSLKSMDAIFGVPPCRFLSMLNVKHDNFAAGDSQNCMMDIAKATVQLGTPLFCFQNAPRLSSSPIALEWAIPQLISIMKPAGYKFTIYKTSTLNHGLPQRRQRTFFIAHKDNHRQIGVYKHKNDPVTVWDLISDLQNQEQNTEYSVGPNTKLQNWFRKNNKVVTSHQAIENWFYWKELMKYCQQPNRSLMFQILYQKQKYNYNWQELVSSVENQKDRQKLLSIFKHSFNKMSMGKGFWDASPMLRNKNGHVNAIISKNAYRLVHPNKTRLLTLRQLSRFMGIPDRFTFHEKSKANALHYITQNVPSFTFANVRFEMKKMKQLDKNYDYLKTDKDLVYIDNISDDDRDLYFAYNVDQIKNSKIRLGKNKENFIYASDKYQKKFLDRV